MLEDDFFKELDEIENKGNIQATHQIKDGQFDNALNKLNWGKSTLDLTELKGKNKNTKIQGSKAFTIAGIICTVYCIATWVIYMSGEFLSSTWGFLSVFTVISIFMAFRLEYSYKENERSVFYMDLLQIIFFLFNTFILIDLFFETKILGIDTILLNLCVNISIVLCSTILNRIISSIIAKKNQILGDLSLIHI